MALKLGYYFSPMVKVPAHLGTGVIIKPKFSDEVERLGGQWEACWQQGDANPLYGVFKIGTPIGIPTATFEIGGVNLMSGNFTDAQLVATTDAQIGAANAARMIDPPLAGE